MGSEDLVLAGQVMLETRPLETTLTSSPTIWLCSPTPVQSKLFRGTGDPTTTLVD